jgi:hypothetical protein
MNNNLNSRIILLVNNSPFLDTFGDYFLHLDQCQTVSEIFERVFVNVAARIGVRWQMVYHAKSNDPVLLAEKIVALILIRKSVMENFNYSETDLEKLFGQESYYLVENYFDTLIKK